MNKYTIKSSYPVHRLEEVLDTIIKPGYDCYFSSDAANGYWAIPRKAKKYKLSSRNEVPSLRYQENNGSFSLCVVESEIERLLSMAHEDHGYYSSELSLSFLVGRAYWPTQVKDVKRWCESCH